MQAVYLHIVVFLVMFYPSHGLNEDHSTSYDVLYESGMNAYKKGHYGECGHLFQSAIDDYHYIKNVIIDCRLKCKNTASETSPDDLSQTFHTILLSANCLRRCKLEILGDRAESEVSYSVDKKFEDRSPYNYVQFCYFKNEQYKKAARASFTYYITHQKDEMMIENLQYYKTMPGVEDSDFVDLERKPYQIQYIRGLQAYNEGDWIEATAGFEEALKLYYVDEERCRIGCEKFYSHVGHPDFINAIADHYVTVIVCQQKCLQKLSTFGMETLDDFVAEHYNYLQYAYYESNNLEKAFESIANYLLFKPDDLEMTRNKNYYIKTLRHKAAAFKPSKEVTEYVEMWRKLEESLDFIREEYILPGDELPREHPDVSEDNTQNDEKDEDPRLSTDPRKRVNLFEKLGIRLVGEWGSVLNEDRYITDGFIRADQCDALSDIARHIYASDQAFKKVTIAEVTELVRFDGDYEFSLRLLLRATDVMRAYTSVYFNHTALFVTDVHVTCRSAGMHKDRELADDCVLQETGECLTADTPHNDFMLVSFLTDVEDETGQFYFLEESDSHPTVQPVCGRVVGFKGHIKHGVEFTQKQERCAIVMTFSEDKSTQLSDLTEARTFLTKLEQEHMKSFTDVNNTDVLEQFYSQGVKIVQAGEDLYGKERFVSDGLSTQDECDEMIDLAKLGVQGSGYRGRSSPHSDHEIFTGLIIPRAEKRGVMQGDGYSYDESLPFSTKFVSPYTESEKFEGLNISRSTQLMKQKMVLPSTLQLLLDVSEHSRLLVEKYFNLTKPLYFDYTHLVCRTAIEDDTDPRDIDLSHPVHADNCMIQSDGSCVSSNLAYAQRHYSAILYMNNDFEGGEFFFAHNNKSEQIAVEPKCGRLVAFNSGEYHGVKAVTKGRRCAIAMWYTHDLEYVEVSRLHAQRAVDATVSKETVTGELKDFEATLGRDVRPMEEDHDEL